MSTRMKSRATSLRRQSNFWSTSKNLSLKTSRPEKSCVFSLVSGFVVLGRHLGGLLCRRYIVRQSVIRWISQLDRERVQMLSTLVGDTSVLFNGISDLRDRASVTLPEPHIIQAVTVFLCKHFSASYHLPFRIQYNSSFFLVAWCVF